MPIDPIDVKYFAADDVEKIIAAAKSLRDKAMLAVLYQCALRRGEVGLLVRDDYRKDLGLLKVTRLKKTEYYTHEIALWKRTKHLLNVYLSSRTDHHDALFMSRKGGDALQGWAVYDIFRKAAVEAKVEIESKPDKRGNRHAGPHRFRHSFAVHSMNFGAPIEDVKEHLGHTSIESTLVYARVLNPRKKRMALLTEMSASFAKF